MCLRQCTRCPSVGRTGIKDESEFYTLKNGKLHGWCKQCVGEFNKDSRQRRAAKVKKYWADYRKKNKKKLAARKKKYYNKNRKKLIAKERARYKQKRDEILPRAKVWCKIYRDNNKEKVKKAKRDWLEKNKGYPTEKAAIDRKNLSNYYVRNLIRSSSKYDGHVITKKEIELKKIKIIILRMNKKLAQTGQKFCTKCRLKKLIAEFEERKILYKGQEILYRLGICKKCANQRSYKYRKKKYPQ